MKVVIAGLGSIGRRHLRNLRACGVEEFVLLRSHRATLPDDELAGLPVETSIEAALAHEPDAIVISNPTALHLDVAIPAAKAGVAILMEKPVSDSMTGMDEFLQIVEENDVPVLVGFQFRWHPGLRGIKNLVEMGEVGRATSVRVRWGEYLPDWHPWEDYRKGYAARKDLGGGVVLTLTHPLDYLRMMFGEVTAEWAFADKVSDLEMDVEDTAEIGLRFENGMIGNVHLDYVQRPPQHSLEVVCTKGSIFWDNADGMVRVFDGEKKMWTEYPMKEGFERNDLFMAQTAHFVAMVRDGIPSGCTLQDGIRAQELALGALWSAEHEAMVKDWSILRSR